MDLAVFKKEELSHGINVPAVTKVMDDGSFYTRALGRGRDQFGRDLTADYFRRVVDPNKSQPDLIIPKSDYEMFVKTNDPMEASMIAIDYYMGTSFDRVEKTIGEKHFIVIDKVPIKSVTKEVNPETGFVDELPYRDNDILKYRAIAHHEKEVPRYEGDCNTEIILHDDCKFVMYKSLGIRKIV